MAIPRIFVSSTCYDLYEIRNNLRNFITEYGFDPVMSEYGDIFYEYDAHIQDSCVKEISKSQIFVLIIGNNYGSIYYNSLSSQPESVTLREFKNAISVNIAKHIFINKFVAYDYKNYMKALEDEYKKYFSENKVSEDEIESTKENIANSFHAKYYFPNNNYKYIFPFINYVYSLPRNNAIFEFEVFDDIKNSLKKQWAGYIYETLSEKSKSIDKSVERDILNEINQKIQLINEFVKKISLNNENSNGNLVIDIKSIKDGLKIVKLEEIQDSIEDSICNIILYMYPSHGYNADQRIVIINDYDEKDVKNWLDSFEIIIETFKWSKTVNILDVFKPFGYKYWKDRDNIEIKYIINLYTIYKSLPEIESDNFVRVIKSKLSKVTTIEDDVPF
jgi:hypothetical protein